MLSTVPPPRQASPLPRRTDSLSTSIARPKSTSVLLQSREDAALARIFLGTPATNEDRRNVEGSMDENRQDDRDRQLTEMLGRMTGWVEELGTLLQQAYKDQTELETGLTLTRSNLQLALANNEMLEEALKRGGGGGKDVGWRRWSEREGVRRSGSVKDYGPPDRPNSVADIPQQQQQHQPSAPSRFFNFKSSLQRISSTNTSPTATSASPPYATASASASSLLPSFSIPSSSRSPSPAPPPSPSTTIVASSVPYSSRTSSPSPTQGDEAQPATSQFYASAHSVSLSTLFTPREKELAALLEKERSALKALAASKAQVEDELESLSQALFEEANKMVSIANRKLAETEEELRIATEQKEALHGALRIVEGENGTLRGSVAERDMDEKRDEHDALGPENQGADVEGNVRNMGKVGSRDDVQTCVTNIGLQEQSKTRPRPPPIPTHSTVSQRPQVQAIPNTAVTDAPPATSTKLKSFWSPVTPLSGSGENTDGDSTVAISGAPSSPSHSRSPPLHIAPGPGPHNVSSVRLPAHTDVQRGIHRWSMLPASPHARSMVRGEFEDALRRMRELVGEEDDDAASSLMNVAKGRKQEGDGVPSGNAYPLEEGKRDDAKATHLEGGVNPWRT